MKQNRRSSQKTEMISGRNSILELLKSGKRKCFEIYYAKGAREAGFEELFVLAERLKIPLKALSREDLFHLSKIEKNQGLVAKVEPFAYSFLAEVLEGDCQTLLILDKVVDPQNFGSLMRTSHQLGVDALIVPKDGSAPVGPAAIRASAGAAEYLPIVQVTNLVSCIKELKSKSFWVYGAAAGADTVNLFKSDFSDRNIALVLGAEGRGMRRLVKENCDLLLNIPMKGKIDSLNVSVAGGILLSEIMRQRAEKS